MSLEKLYPVHRGRMMSGSSGHTVITARVELRPIASESAGWPQTESVSPILDERPSNRSQHVDSLLIRSAAAVMRILFI